MNYWPGSEKAVILPGGTKPANIARMLEAIQYSWANPGTGMLVPISPDRDPQVVRADLARRVSPQLPPNVNVILQTSGSTSGHGHLVGLSKLALQAAARASAAALSGPGRWIVALPVHHVSGFQMLVRSLVAGIVPRVVDTTAGFSAQALARAARNAVTGNEPVYTSIVPTQLRRILAADPKDIAALARLDAILVGGQACDQELLTRGRGCGLKLVTTYGMTETGGGCVYNNKPLPGVKVATIDNRIWLSGTTLMEGYVDDLTSPDIVTSQGRRWLRTSDYGCMDGANLSVMGRVDDVINTGGVKVNPHLIEQSLQTLPGIDEVCIVGLPDPQWGQIVTAVFSATADADETALAAMRRRAKLTHKNTTPTAEESSPQLQAALAQMAAAIRGDDTDDATTVLTQVEKPLTTAERDRDIALQMRAHIAAELGRSQAPRIVCLVESLPRLSIGKIDRRAVIELAREAVGAERAWVR